MKLNLPLKNLKLKWTEKIPKWAWILIIVLLSGLLISMFVDLPLGKKFESISYQGFKSLERSDEEYFLLVCNRSDPQCEYIKNGLIDLKTAKHDIYYFDTNSYIERFEEEGIELVNEYNAILEDMGVEQTPVIQRRKGSEILNGIEGFYDNEYFNMLNNGEDLNGKIVSLTKIYIEFVKN